MQDTGAALLLPSVMCGGLGGCGGWSLTLLAGVVLHQEPWDSSPFANFLYFNTAHAQPCKFCLASCGACWFLFSLPAFHPPGCPPSLGCSMEGPPPTCDLLGAPTRLQTVLLAFPAQSPDKPLGPSPSFTTEPAETSPLRPFGEGMLLLPTVVIWWVLGRVFLCALGHGDFPPSGPSSGAGEGSQPPDFHPPFPLLITPHRWLVE